MMATRQVTVAEFEAHSRETDQLEAQDRGTAILGLVGEVGSLLSALKKKRRDTDGFFGYHEAVVEELGDVLWYISAVARVVEVLYSTPLSGWSMAGLIVRP